MLAIENQMNPAPYQVRTGRECPSPHSTANKLGRLFWDLVWLVLFRPSRLMGDGWRRGLLRLFGAKIGRGARIMPSARVWAPWNLEMGDNACLSHHVDCYCVAPIRIGAQATVSQYTFLCTATHDLADAHMRLQIAPITIADQAWVCAGVYVAPGITVGPGAVCGAWSAVTRDVAPWTVVAGQPARVLRRREIRPDAHETPRHGPDCRPQ
jgi:putative colanic acid biosynthesis acetyltransferase WcaF